MGGESRNLAPLQLGFRQLPPLLLEHMATTVPVVKTQVTRVATGHPEAQGRASAECLWCGQQPWGASPNCLPPSVLHTVFRFLPVFKLFPPSHGPYLLVWEIGETACP